MIVTSVNVDSCCPSLGVMEPNSGSSPGIGTLVNPMKTTFSPRRKYATVVPVKVDFNYYPFIEDLSKWDFNN